MKAQSKANRKEATRAFEGLPYLLRVSEVAAILGISRASVYRLCDSGDLHVTRLTLSGIRGSVRILRDSAEHLLDQWLESGSVS